MKMYESWEKQQEYIDQKTIRIEEKEGDLKLYNYFSTLRWKWCYAIVYKDMLLREYEDMDYYDEWDMAVDMLNLLQNKKA